MLTIRVRSSVASAVLQERGDRGGQRAVSRLAVVWDDKDGCYSVEGFLKKPFQDCPGGDDEAFVEFTPDPYDAPGLYDGDGNDDVRDALVDDAPGNEKASLSNRGGAIDVGPKTGGGWRPPGAPRESDGFGFGADDDFPHLIVVADVGAGRFFDKSFNISTGKMKLRNFAGLAGHHFFEWQDEDGALSIVTMIPVRRGTFEPIAQLDMSATKGDFAEFDFVRRYESNPPQGFTFDGPPPKNIESRIQKALRDSEVIHTVVIRAWIVKEHAPAVLQDENGDGEITAEDSRLANYTVLSNMATLVVRQVREEVIEDYVSGSECPYPGTIVFTDLDGDGESGVFRDQCVTGSARSTRRVPD